MIKFLRKGILFSFFCFTFLTIIVSAAEKPGGAIQPMRVLIIFDVSKSMMAPYESGTRMDAAKSMAFTIIDSLAGHEGLQMALRAYGASKQYPPGDCTDSKLIFNFEPGNTSKIKEYIKGLQPTGITPIAYSLDQAVSDFSGTETKNFIIIVTDGIEECGGNICQAAIRLSERGIVLRPFIVGIGLTEEQSREFQCVGNYFNAGKKVTFSNLSNIIITQILNPTSVQVNLLDKSGKPNETNVAMTFYDLKDHQPEYNFIHTLDKQGNPDTLYLDVYKKYSVTVSTVPMVKIDTAVQILGKNNVFAVNAPQGELKLSMKSPLADSDPICIVRKQGEMQTLNYQKFNTSFKYLCGTYDIEVVTSPRIIMQDVFIGPQGNTINIPASGQVQIQSAKKILGSVMMDRGNGLELVCNLPPDGVQSYSIFLQPGKYLLVYKNKGDKSILNTYKRNFIISERNVLTLQL